MSLARLIDQELPLNRKERFFTGTVLPMIVCKDNFAHLHVLLELAGCDDSRQVSVIPGQENVEFFSEYSFVESAIGMSGKRFPDLPKVKDTPDIMILIKTNVSKVLIALEAKMYDATTAEALTRQMDDQRNHILAYLEQALQLTQVYHVALLPAKLYRRIRACGFDKKAILWEDLHERYTQVLRHDYFLEMLRIALDRYDELSGKTCSYGANCEKTYRGREIYDACKNGTLDAQIMGRNRGLHGPELRDDIATGKWQTHKYEASSGTKPPNRNWFFVQDFVALIDSQQPRR
jgi:hypothetical protein